MSRSGKTIGLVLAGAPRYSETFLINKIKGLIFSGFRVILFTDKRTEVEHEFHEIAGYRLPVNSVFRVFAVMSVLAVLCLRTPKRLLRFYRLERTDGSDISLFAKRVFVSAHILPFKVDYLHFCFATLGVNRENLGKTLGARVSVSFRGFDIGLFPLSRPGVYGRLWKSLDKVHTISDDLYRKATALGLPESVPCVKIMPAVDPELFIHERDYGRSTNFIRILTVARLQWKKGLEMAIDAMAILKARGVRFEYKIIGEGVEKERLLFARYQWDLQEEVVLEGKKQHFEVAELMRDYDIYIQPSLQEGFCNAVLEAQASGLLCIVSDAEGLAENVIDGVTGWIIARGDATSLANMIMSVSKLRSAEKSRVGARAVERIKKDFSLEGQRRQFVRFFEHS